MGSFISNDDIFEYLIPFIDIKEYDKLKKVSRKFNNIFNLSYLIYNKIYHKLICIRGCTQANILNIMERFILTKYNFKKSKHIVNDILKSSNTTFVNSIIHSKFSTIIENLMDLIYNISHKKYKNLLKILNSIYANGYTGCSNNFSIICKALKVCFNIINNFDQYHVNRSKLYRLNISMFIYITIKALDIEAVSKAIEEQSLNIIFKMQNNKLDEYKEMVNRENKIFPKYYKRSILELIDKLYITRELF